MSDAGDKYCVLLAREQELDVRAVTRLLAEFFGAPLPEIALTVRRGCGFLASSVPRVIAVEMQRKLDELGVETLLLTHSSLVPLPYPSVVKAVEFGPKALLTYARRDAHADETPYSRILFLSVCVLMQAGTARESRVEGPKSIRDTLHRFNPVKSFHESIERSAIKPRPKPTAFLDIFTKSPRNCYRMARSALDYRRLGSGKSKTARENFLAVLRTLTEKAPKAYVTLQTRQFMGGADPEGIAFTDTAEIRRCHTWLLNVLGGE